MEKLKKGIRIGIIHIGFWLLYLFLLFMIFNFMMMGKVSPDRDLVDTIFTWYLLLPAIASYIAYYWLVFSTYTRKSALKALLVAALSSAVIAFITLLGLEIQLKSEVSAERIKNVLISMYVFEAFLCTVVGSIAFIIRTFGEWFKDQKLKRELKEKNHKMELEVVKAQLDPHFLFNSLNNIDVLIQKDANKASEYLNMLSDLLRYTLNPSKAERVSLSTEVEYIKKYIHLQKIRSSNKSLVDFETKGDLENKKIPPLLFIPFLENAFKYHQYSDKDSKIVISLKVDEGRIGFECSNKISEEGVNQFSSFKIGNDLIGKRLNLLYPESHELNISDDNGIYQVSLILR